MIMDANDTREGKLRAALARWAIQIAAPEADRFDLPVSAGELRDAVQAVTDAGWGHLAAITGLDHGPEKATLEALYHFCSGPVTLTLRVQLPRAAPGGPTVPSICPIVRYASVFERELSEMFGVTVADTPDPSRLFLPDDWPAGVYPLRKDAPVQETPESGEPQQARDSQPSA